VAGLRKSLRALGEGDLAGWRPLPQTVTAAQLKRAAPDGQAGQGQEWLLGQPATSWRLPSTAAAPFGVVVWLQGDQVVLVEVRDPLPLVDPETALGAPEAVIDSGLGPAQEQRLWPSRGLILHVDRVTGGITRLYAHEARTTDEMLDSPLVEVRLERRRHRDD
jgi:hypothetical protein